MMLYATQPIWSFGPELGALSERDRQIILSAQRKLRHARVDFAEALRALRESVEEAIPAGRVFHLGATELGPIVGSIISGVGIANGLDGVRLVQVSRDGQQRALGRLVP